MNIEDFRNYCLSKPGVSEDFPFDQRTLVFKVGGKMFALADIDYFESINIKCDPVLATELREEYPDVRPGYHMNKKHWNTIMMQGNVPDKRIREWIDHSYQLVLEGLPLKIKSTIRKI